MSGANEIRMQAHADLWIHLVEICPYVPALEPGDDEILEQIFLSCCHYLHPHHDYSYIKLYTAMVIVVMGRMHPRLEKYLLSSQVDRLWGSAFSRWVASRIQIQ